MAESKKETRKGSNLLTWFSGSTDEHKPDTRLPSHSPVIQLATYRLPPHTNGHPLVCHHIDRTRVNCYHVINLTPYETKSSDASIKDSFQYDTSLRDDVDSTSYYTPTCRTGRRKSRSTI